MTNYYQSTSEIEAVVRGFESCTIAKDQFAHREHLTVAVWYLRRASLAEANQRMRAGLLRFLEHHGVDQNKYNETITRFWIALVSVVVDGFQAPITLVESANAVTEALGDSRLIFDYYTKERLSSEEARTGWIGPDLQNLPSSMRSWEA